MSYTLASLAQEATRMILEDPDLFELYAAPKIANYSTYRGVQPYEVACWLGTYDMDHPHRDDDPVSDADALTYLAELREE